jgi:hypothetical protein
MAINLPDIDAAIEAISGGSQSFTVDGMTYSKASLAALHQLRTDLIREQSRSAGNRPLFRQTHMSNAGYSS